MFRLADGRDKLYQWDSNIKLLVDENFGSIDAVHFASRFSRTSLSKKIVVENSVSYVVIPNILLTKSYDIFVYAYVHGDNGNYTKFEKTFEVISRPKPSDYVYTETDVLNYLTLSNRIDLLSGNKADLNTVPNAASAEGNTLKMQRKTTVGENTTTEDLFEVTLPSGTGTVTSVNGNAPDENGNVEVEVGQPTDEQISAAVNTYLDNHPESMTTVEDGAITESKLAVGAVSAEKSSIYKLVSDETAQFNILAEIEWEGQGYWNGTTWVENISRYTSKNFTVTQNVLYAQPGKKNDWLDVDFYGADDTKISSFSSGYMTVGSTYEVNVPDNTVYCRVTLRAQSYAITDPKDTTTVGMRLLENRSVKTYKLNETDYIKYRELSDFAKLDGYLLNFKKWSGKKVVFDGNSLTSGYRQETPWVDVLCSLLGITAYNHAISGSTLIANRTVNDVTYTAVEKVNSLYEDDADCIFLVGDSNFVAQYSLSDFENLKVAIGDPTDTVAGGKTTWSAKMNEVIDAIFTKYPTAPVILMTDPPRSSTEDSNITNGQYSIMRDAIEALCRHRRLVFFDTFTISPYRPWLGGDDYEYANFVNNDDVHFGKMYAKMLAQVVMQMMTTVLIKNDL